MKREYRVREEDDYFYPEWKTFWTFGKWKKFYFTKDSDLEDRVFVRSYKTENEAWRFIEEMKKRPKFRQFETERGDDIIN